MGSVQRPDDCEAVKTRRPLRLSGASLMTDEAGVPLEDRTRPFLIHDRKLICDKGRQAIAEGNVISRLVGAGACTFNPSQAPEVADSVTWTDLPRLDGLVDHLLQVSAMDYQILDDRVDFHSRSVEPQKLHTRPRSAGGKVSRSWLRRNGMVTHAGSDGSVITTLVVGWWE